MATHDYNIANQTAAQLRADLNNALLAIVSNNTSSTEPTTKFAGMWWVDTTNNELKIRNEANDAWVVIGKFTGDNKIESNLPAGAVSAFAQSSAPTGWLKCNGQLVSRTTYADLFSAIGTTYSAGDGSTTFGVPDLRGEFIRGFDDGRGVDSGRAFASAQTDEFEAHNHTQAYSNNVTYDGRYGEETGVSSNIEDGFGTAFSTTAPLTSTAGTASETRPRNIALMYCIKY